MRTVWLLLLTVGLSGGSVRAQLGSEPLKSPRLSLGISAGAPGSDTELQLKLAGPPGMEIVSIEAVISLPGALEFKEMTGSLLAAEIVKGETKLQEPKNGRADMLVSIESGGPEKPLPPEVLANLSFKVRKDAKLGVLTLGLKAKAFGRDGQEVGPVEVFGGRINIQEPAVFYSCFFYMH